MKSVIASLWFVVLSGGLSPQPLRNPHTGERPLLELTQWLDEDHLTDKGKPCGKYFMYQMVQNRAYVTLKLPVTEAEERRVMLSLIGVDIRSIQIKLDDEKRVPTAEWASPKKGSLFLGELLIRISTQD